MSTSIQTMQHGDVMQIDPNSAIFDGDRFAQIEKFAQLMATGKATVPDHLKNSKGDCLAVTMQAAQWGMNPFAVAQKTHIVNGTLGYEAQLVNAVISSSNAIQGRFHYEYGGDWSQLLGYPPKKEKKTYGQKEVWQTKKGWPDDNENGLFIKVGATIRGESEITWGEPVYLAGVDIRNSPLWATHPKQQIAYLAVKMWARMYTPAVILGVYTPDEIEVMPREVKDITPNEVDKIDEYLNIKAGSISGEQYSLDDYKREIDACKTYDEFKTVGPKGRDLPINDQESGKTYYMEKFIPVKKAAKAALDAEKKAEPKFKPENENKSVSNADNDQDAKTSVENVIDDEETIALIDSLKWSKSVDDLDAIMNKVDLNHPSLVSIKKAYDARKYELLKG